jgi:hypothetical protein
MMAKLRFRPSTPQTSAVSALTFDGFAFCAVQASQGRAWIRHQLSQRGKNCDDRDTVDDATREAETGARRSSDRRKTRAECHAIRDVFRPPSFEGIRASGGIPPGDVNFGVRGLKNCRSNMSRIT